MVRHGKTPSTGKILPGRAKGLRLSDIGKQEAIDVAQRLSNLKNISAIYASPLERARETAAPTAKLLNQKVIIEKGLL